MAKKRNTDRDTSRDYAEIIPIPKEYSKELKEFNYTKCLKIVLYGEPFSDSRPKPNMKTGGIQLKNQQEMKVTFGRFFRRCDLLKELTITSSYSLKCDFYLPMTQVDQKAIKKMSKFAQHLYKTEKLRHMGDKDIDNMIKIHNDILLQPEFRITLTDGFQVGQLRTDKYVSEDPRAVVYVFFSDKEKCDYYRHKIEDSSHYFYWQISYKNWKYQSNRTPAQQLKHMRKVITDELSKYKRYTEIKRKVSNIMKELTLYKAEDLKELANIDPSNKMNRIDAEFKLGLLLFEKIPLAYELIQQGGKRIEQMSSYE